MTLINKKLIVNPYCILDIIYAYWIYIRLHGYIYNYYSSITHYSGKSPNTDSLLIPIPLVFQ